MNIVFVCDSWRSTRGGIQTVNRELAAAIARAHRALRVFCAVPSPTPEEISSAAKEYEVTLLKAGDHYLEVVPFFQKIRPEFIVGHSYFTGPAAEALAKMCSSLWIQVVHVDPEDNESWKEYRLNRVGERVARSRTELELCSGAHGVVCIGPRLYRDYKARLASFQRTQPNVIRVDCGMTQSPVRVLPDSMEVLSMGRGDSIQVKGLDVVAYAAGLVYKNLERLRPKLRFRVRGATTNPDALEEQLKKMAGEACPDALVPIHVLPYDPEIETLRQDLARARVLLMPSRVEGYGLVAFEAMSMGIPVLVSEQSGAAELIGEVAPDDELVRKLILPVASDYKVAGQLWAQRVSDVLIQYEVYERLVRDLRERLGRIASWDVAAQTMLTFCDSLLTSRGTGQEQNATKLSLNAQPFETVPMEYLSRLPQTAAEHFALTWSADQHYSLARTAANDGKWDESYREHLLSLAIWRKVEDEPRIARSLGRLGWCLLAQGDVELAHKLLTDAVQRDATQGAANFFWAAQYCFRAGRDQDAREMLAQFVRTVLDNSLAKLSPEELFSETGPLAFIASFYENVVSHEEGLGWAQTTWSDRRETVPYKSCPR